MPSWTRALRRKSAPCWCRSWSSGPARGPSRTKPSPTTSPSEPASLLEQLFSFWNTVRVYYVTLHTSKSQEVWLHVEVVHANESDFTSSVLLPLFSTCSHTAEEKWMDISDCVSSWCTFTLVQTAFWDFQWPRDSNHWWLLLPSLPPPMNERKRVRVSFVFQLIPGGSDWM